MTCHGIKCDRTHQRTAVREEQEVAGASRERERERQTRNSLDGIRANCNVITTILWSTKTTCVKNYKIINGTFYSVFIL